MRGLSEISGDWWRNVQLDLCPSLLLCGVDDGLLFRLGTGFDGIAVSIVPDYGGDFGISGLVLLSWEAGLRDHVSPRVSAPTKVSKGGGKGVMDARHRLE